MTTVITIEYSVPDATLIQLAADLITTAVEGGINYWATTGGYRWDDEHPEATRVTIFDEEEHTAPVEVDVPKMRDTLIKLVRDEYAPFFNIGYNTTYRERLMTLLAQYRDNPEMHLLDADYDFDAIDADCMMQLAVFGEIPYG